MTRSVTPAPSRTQKEILGALLTKFYNFLDDKECRVYVAPFDVRLPEGEEKNNETATVVQLDMVVVCDQSKPTVFKSARSAIKESWTGWASSHRVN